MKYSVKNIPANLKKYRLEHQTRRAVLLHRHDNDLRHAVLHKRNRHVRYPAFPRRQHDAVRTRAEAFRPAPLLGWHRRMRSAVHPHDERPADLRKRHDLPGLHRYPESVRHKAPDGGLQCRRAVPAGTSQRVVQFLGLLPDDALVLPVPRGKLLRNHRKGGKATEVLLPDPHQMARCGRQVYHMDIRSPSAGSLWNFQPYIPSLTLPEKRIFTYPGWRTSIFCLHINVGF